MRQEIHSLLNFIKTSISNADSDSIFLGVQRGKSCISYNTEVNIYSLSSRLINIFQEIEFLAVHQKIRLIYINICYGPDCVPSKVIC